MRFLGLSDPAAYTPEQQICIRFFLFPLCLLILSFGLLYQQLFQHGFEASTLLLEIAKCLVVIFWAYFPCIGAYFSTKHFVLENINKDKDKEKNTFVSNLFCILSDYRFWRLFLIHVPLLIALLFFTAWNIGVSLKFESLKSPIPILSLELVWILLQAFSIFTWTQDNDNKKIDSEKWITVYLFLLPLSLLIASAYLAHLFNFLGLSSVFRTFECFENILFVYFPSIQSYVWIRRKRQETSA